MVDPIYYKGKFVPFLDEFVSYKGKLFAIAKDEDGLNYTLYQANGFRKRLFHQNEKEDRSETCHRV